MAQDFNFACIAVFRRLLTTAGAADKETRGQGAGYGDKKVLAIHILHSLSPYLSFSAAAWAILLIGDGFRRAVRARMWPITAAIACYIAISGQCAQFLAF
jgi:hypothetical protein